MTASSLSTTTSCVFAMESDSTSSRFRYIVEDTVKLVEKDDALTTIDSVECGDDA